MDDLSQFGSLISTDKKVPSPQLGTHKKQYEKEGMK